METCINKKDSREKFYEKNKDTNSEIVKQKHLPKYVYNLLSGNYFMRKNWECKDKKIKALLKSSNLSTKGDRQALISR